jgi:hypothetical protein
MSGKNVFVFVVCGADEHIATLNYSLKQLKRFSKNRIVVVTDTSRNNVNIDHDNIITISTPSAFDHHQASIYLKTSLHRIFDLADNYCYLDSDVIALSPQVDEVFQHRYGPVTFAADHCDLRHFSPYALHCNCFETKNKEHKEFVETVKRIIPDYKHEILFRDENVRDLYRILSEIKNNPVKKVRMILNYFMARYAFKKTNRITRFGNGMKFSSRKKGWIDLKGNIVMYDLTSFAKKIKSSSEFSFQKKKKIWVNAKGENIHSIECDHLIEEIHRKFNILITDKNYQHWNGGVFLFNIESFDFMEAWHKNTLSIFADSQWKTRDQGTLAATLWQFGLQHQKTLPSEFNFIVDFFNPEVTYHSTKGFTSDNFMTIVAPKFIHVYHEFGNKNWDIWRTIDKILNNNA